MQSQTSFAQFCQNVLGSCSILLILSSFDGSLLANPISISQATSNTSSEANQAIDKQLLGQWKLNIQQMRDEWKINQGSAANLPEITIIFTPEGKLFWIDSTYPGKAIELQYKTNSKTQPKQLDVSLKDERKPKLETLETIYQFTADGQLRVEAGMENGRLRPTAFTQKTFILQKVSSVAELPANVEVVDVLRDQAIKAKQSEARQYVGSMNRSQQAYFLENNQFSAKLDSLGLGIKSETENYRYSINLIDGKRLVQHMGVAKVDGLKSYTGFVQLTKIRSGESAGELTTVATLCESNQPTRSQPGKPQIQGNEIKCPIGYSDLSR
jgi:uncharacterized protein (TIGR03067 family)